MSREFAIYSWGVILICAGVTMFIRFLPFIFFGSRELPPSVRYLGRMLPGSIMVILVIFCLKDVSFLRYPYGIPELISMAVCAVLKIRTKNTIPSIAVSTLVYMILTRTLFAV